MAIPWLVVLKSVPWTDVIRNAPKVAEGARKLWDSVGKKPPRVVTPPPARATSEQPFLAELRAQVDGLAVTTADLHAQMLDSSELIKTLAEQNTQLVARIEANRVRVRWLTVAVVVLVVAQVAGWISGV